MMASASSSGSRRWFVAAVAFVAFVAICCNAANKEFLFDTFTSEEQGGGFGNKWNDMTEGDNTMRDYFNSNVGEAGEAGLFSLKLDFNQCPWRGWTAFSLHSRYTFTAKEDNFLFFRFGGNERAFKELIIEFERWGRIHRLQPISELLAGPLKAAEDDPADERDASEKGKGYLKKPWHVAVPLKQLMNKWNIPNNKYDRVAFKVKYYGSDDYTEYFMTDMFIGTIKGENRPESPMDSRNWRQFDEITEKDEIYNGDTAAPPFYVNSNWRDWSWGALLPRQWNMKWKIDENWVKNVVTNTCDNNEDQEMTLLSKSGFKVNDNTKLHFKYSGDWRDVKLHLQNKNDPSVEKWIPLSLNQVASTDFKQAVIPLGAAKNDKNYNMVEFVHTGTLWARPGHPKCTQFGATAVLCQTVYIADMFVQDS